jgi:phosphomannomutase
MHGVGYQWIMRAFVAFYHNISSLYIVHSQQAPDAQFSTVSFPNPEEKGALDESIRYANTNGCTLIVANDPDADRLAVAEKNGATNAWKLFSGNEIGVLLGYWQIVSWKKEHPTKTAAVLASVVSSRMLKTIAKVEGIQYHDTLTGLFCFIFSFQILFIYSFIFPR